jgi:hypothetical protein
MPLPFSATSWLHHVQAVLRNHICYGIISMHVPAPSTKRQGGRKSFKSQSRNLEYSRKDIETHERATYVRDPSSPCFLILTIRLCIRIFANHPSSLVSLDLVKS